MEDLRIKKCLKSYLTAKKYYETDIDKSFEYFKQCIHILNDLKDKNIPIKEDLVNIIDETETECSKYLTNTIEKTMDRAMNRYDNQANKTSNDLFELIETGKFDKLKEYKFGEINFNINNEDGLTPLHYAIKFGDTSFLKQAFKLGATIDQTNKFGHTLLEYACLEKDPNMINFLLLYGADMKKHLLFREGKKYFNSGKQIDNLLLEKYIIEYENKLSNSFPEIKYLNFIFNYINENEIIDLAYCEPNNSIVLSNTISVNNLIKKLDMLIDTFNNDARNTFINILKEELQYDLTFKLGCPINKIEIILYNLVPFINFNENLKLNWLLCLEIKFIILNILKKKVNINTKQLKNELIEIIHNSYIKSEIVQEGFIKIIILQWIYKIKV